MKPQTLSRTVSSHVFVYSPQAVHVAEAVVWPRWPSLFLLLGLLLLSLSVNAARLELDRKELLVGEVTTVHLKGKPFIAIVDWKVSPELEIIDSDSDHAQVRGIREGSGSVTCEMNLSIHTIEIKVRAAAKPTPPPAYVPPVVSPPVASPPPPTYQAPARAASQSSLAGTWRINANGYTGKLELGSTQGMLIGRVWFDARNVWEPLEELYFDEAIGELSFTRPGANQFYRGRLQQDTLEGRFNQWSGRDYSANAPSYNWSASRSTVSAPPAQAAARPVAIAELVWQGMDQDKVGDWGNGRPNGTPDGGFRLTLDLPDKQVITSISLWSANDKGEKAGGHVWHSKAGGYWMLGVFREGRQINPSHVASLGEFSGKVALDLYANSSGRFNPGEHFLLEVETADGKVLTRTIQIEKAAARLAGLIAHLTMDGLVMEHVAGTPARNNGAQPTTDRQGREGGALLFDGKSYLELDLDINPAKRPQLTIAAWVRADSDQPIQQVASHDNGGYDRSLNIDYRGGGRGWSAFAGSGAVLGVKPVRVGEWVFVAGVWDQSARTLRLHVDGDVFEKSGSSGNGTANLRIGMNPGYGEYFKGAMDELWVFDRALAPNEIAALRGDAPAAAASSIAGIWNINANNYSGKLELSERAGQLSGRVWFDVHRNWEELRDISFDGRELRFFRPGPSQRYTGTLAGDQVHGSFDQGGSGAWKWTITRAADAKAGSEASLSLSRDRYAPGDAIVVNFTASADYADNAWIGIIPSRVPHGSEAENDRHDLSYQYLKKRAAGSMTFIAPKEPGDYDLRMHDTDNNGREVASVSFRVSMTP